MPNDSHQGATGRCLFQNPAQAQHSYWDDRCHPPGVCFIDIPPLSTHRETCVLAMGFASSHHHHQHASGRGCLVLLRKEVIQPHLPVRLPCYDLVPIASPTFDSSLPQGVRPPASGVTNFRDLTGGVYKARERIHRSVADLRLLATPTSWGRVADPNPN